MTENYKFSHGMYERVMSANGRQLKCTLTPTCSYVTTVWHVDDGSAEQEFYEHKWRAHEPETEASK
jgi:hypothetical protein